MQEILNMVRYVAVFYLMEQIVLQLLPGKAYEKYVRFYLGLLLVLILLQPIFRIFQMSGQVEQRTEELMRELDEEVERLR